MLEARLPRDEAHLLYAERSAVTPALERSYLEVLSAAERERHARFAVPVPALEFLLGRALLRSALGAYLGVAPAAVALRLGPQGKPELADPALGLAFSLSHSHGLVACLVARDCEVGVDVEDTGREVEAVSLAQRFFDPVESADVAALPPEARCRRFFEYWTLKEACLKALGTGLSQPLDRFRFQLRAAGAPRLLGEHDDPAEWQLAQLRIDAAFLVAVAIRERERPRPPRTLVVKKQLPLER